MVALTEEGNLEEGQSSYEVDFTVRSDLSNKRIKKVQSVRLKNGPRAIKQASLVSIGEPDSDEIKKTSLVLRTWRKKNKADGGGYDFERPDSSWNLDNAEGIKSLQILLNEQLPETGIYQALSKDDKRNRISKKILDGEIDADFVSSFAEAVSSSPEAQVLLATTPLGAVFTDAVNLRRHRIALDLLEEIARDPSKNEHNLQASLQDQWWIFGGRFISLTKRRSFTVLEQLDIPLLRPDGSLHIVELKQANIPRLLISDHNKAILGPEVHLAVTQAMNYLNAFDEQRAQILKDFKIDSHRAAVTIVIGHVDFINSDYDSADLAEALRTYNSHLSRVQVITYDDLIASARRSLKLAD